MNALANPLSLFDIAGRVAVVTGASGAFGAVAAQVLAGAGARLVLVAGNAEALAETAAACDDAEIMSINARPSDEAACDRIVAETVARFGKLAGIVASEHCLHAASDDRHRTVQHDTFWSSLPARTMSRRSRTWLRHVSPT